MNTHLGRMNLIVKESRCFAQLPPLRWLRPIATAILLFLGASAFAAFPPALVINGTACSGVQITGSNWAYSPPNCVFVLSGSNGGPVSSGTSVADALAALTTGTWGAPSTVNLSDNTIVVPQVLVYSGSSVTSLQGYDGLSHSAVGTGTSTDGSALVAFGDPGADSLPDGYIFSIGCSDGPSSPIYRYQSGSAPVCISKTPSGWPPAFVSIFPQTVSVSGTTLTCVSGTSVTEGFANGYWSNMYYSGTSNAYGELHLYISVSGTTGDLWGNIDGMNVSASWDPSTAMSTPLLAPFAAPSASPNYGPPNIEWNGVLMSFKYSDANGSDVYCDSTNSKWAVVNSSYSVIASDSYTTISGSYNPNPDFYSGDPNAGTDEGFPNMGDFAGVTSDGTGFVGLPPGVTIITTGSSPTGNFNLFCGGTTISKSIHMSGNGNCGGPIAVQYGSQIYLVSVYNNGTTGNYYLYDYTINATNGWPAGDVSVPDFPSQVYFNGELLTAGSAPGIEGGGAFLWSGQYYSNASGDYCYLEKDMVPGQSWMAVQSSGSFQGNYISDWLWPDTIITVYPSNGQSFSLYVSGVSSGAPNFGPKEIAWNGVTMQGFDTGQGFDTYEDAVSGEYVSISGSNVTVGGPYSASGTYNSTTKGFDFNNDPNMANILALDASGHPIGTNLGLVIYSFDGSGQSIQLISGTTVLSSSNGQVFTFTRNDGAQGYKYMGLPEGAVFAIQKSDGNYASTPYRFSVTSGTDFVIESESASTNIFPTTLYINGHYAGINGSTFTWNPNPSGNCGVSYQRPSNGETFSLILPTSGSNAIVTGTYSTFGPFSGTWDGGALFTGLPQGLIISITPPPFQARYGPPMIQWNGLELTFDPLASSVCPDNPSGWDVYRDTDGLGIRLTIDGNGNVVAIDDTGTYTGTYNPVTFQFGFSGSSPGAVNALSSQGFLLLSSSGYSGAGNGPTLESMGNLDVQGNVFSLGSWLNLGTSTPGLSLTFNDVFGSQPSLIQFAASRQSTEWVWSHAQLDGNASQAAMMMLDSANRLCLYAPGFAVPPLVLDPSASGVSQIPGTLQISGTVKVQGTMQVSGTMNVPGTLLIQRQGDLDMGNFTSGPQPTQSGQ